MAIRRVLISVTDKTGIIDFARALSELGAEIISTGGTARMIRENGVPVRDVSEVTGFPEMLDGRVKTMHPEDRRRHSRDPRTRGPHGAPSPSTGSRPIDMVVVNLYRFEEVAAKAGARLEELIENIDIGGPTMIRAAAKNYQDVAVVVSPSDYDAIVAELRGGGAVRRDQLAAGQEGVPHHGRLRCGDQRASGAGGEEAAGHLPAELHIRAPKLMDLRYGENPHQSAALYGRRGAGVAGGGAVAGQGALVQQPGGSGRRLATRLRILRSGGRHHQAHQSVRMRGAGHAGGGVPQGAGVRSRLGVRRRDRAQSRGG